MKLIVQISGLYGSCRSPKNTIVNRAFIKIMLVYSAMENNVNGPVAYST